MKRPFYPLLAAISILLIALPARTARRPRYGGTLRLEIEAAIHSLDPAVAAASPAEAAAKEQLDALLYDYRGDHRGESRGAGGTFTGSGAFRISAWEPGKHVVLAANDDAPGGRPFLDAIDVQMGRPARQRMLDLELNRADVAEIPAGDARQAAARGIRLSISNPDELVAIEFAPGRKIAEDAPARQALSLAVDRAAIAAFLLQKEGQAAGGILPQWSSGTAFLFPTTFDPASARQLWSEIPGSPKLMLGYDSDDPLEHMIAERIAVDAQAAGISLAAQPSASGATARADDRGAVDARLIRWRMPSPRPGPALADFVAFAGPQAALGAPPLPDAPDKASPEQIYQCEAGIIAEGRVIPLVWLPQVYGLSARVRDWNAPAPGAGWPLADVWLDGGAP